MANDEISIFTSIYIQQNKSRNAPKSVWQRKHCGDTHLVLMFEHKVLVIKSQKYIYRVYALCRVYSMRFTLENALPKKKKNYETKSFNYMRHSLTKIQSYR